MNEKPKIPTAADLENRIEDKLAEQAIEDAANVISAAVMAKETIRDKEDSPDLSGANRDLLQRSSKSFANHLVQLDARIADVHRGIEKAIEAKNAEIRQIEERHRAFMIDAEKDLYQIKTLKAAVELAVIALGGDD